MQVFNSDGVFIEKWGSAGGRFMFPQGIGVDSEGKVYVLDSSRIDVQIFTAVN